MLELGSFFAKFAFGQDTACSRLSFNPIADIPDFSKTQKCLIKNVNKSVNKTKDVIE